MNNKGEVPGWLWIVGIGIILLLVTNPGILSSFKKGPTTPGTVDSNYIVSSSTALSFAAVDALSPGTKVGSTSQISVNGAPFTTGITTASQGDQLEIYYL